MILSIRNSNNIQQTNSSNASNKTEEWWKVSPENKHFVCGTITFQLKRL